MEKDGGMKNDTVEKGRGSTPEIMRRKPVHLSQTLRKAKKGFEATDTFRAGGKGELLENVNKEHIDLWHYDLR